jgi:hypothetical protein
MTLNEAAAIPRCELDGCNRKQSRTGWRIIVNGEALRVCGHHAAIDRENRIASALSPDWMKKPEYRG